MINLEVIFWVFDEEQLAVMGVVYTTRYLDQGIVACDDICN